MDTVSYTRFRRHLAAYMAQVQADRVALNVRRGTTNSVVVLGEDQYREILETLQSRSQR